MPSSSQTTTSPLNSLLTAGTAPSILNQKTSGTGPNCTLIAGEPCPPCAQLHKLQDARPQGTNSARDSNAMCTFRNEHHRLRRLINDLHDPFKNLPLELLCEIFREVSRSPPNKAGGQMAVASVCKKWRDAILADPIFWSTLHIPYIKDGRFRKKEIKQWLSHSHQLPLSITFLDDEVDDDILMKFMNEEIDDDAFIRFMNRDVAILKATEEIKNALIGQKNRIRALDATNSLPFSKAMVQGTTTDDTTWPKLAHIVIDDLRISEVHELFRRCPLLESANIQNIYAPPPKNETHLIKLHHLRSLSLGFSLKQFPAGSLIACLETPALKEVEYKYEGDCPSSSPDLEALFTRSGCSITSLRLQYATFERDSLVSLLKSQPSLRRFATELYPFLGLSTRGPRSFDAFGTVLKLLVTDGRRRLDLGQYVAAEEEFLPNLEVLEHAGAMLYPWDDLADVYSAHSEIADERQLDPTSVNGVSSTIHRPLRILRFTINGHVPQERVDDRLTLRMYLEDMIQLNPLREDHVRRLTSKHHAYNISTEINGGCRFECDRDIARLFAILERSCVD